MNALLASAIGAAINDFIRFYAVADDSTPAVSAGRRQTMNRAFKTIETVFLARHRHFKGEMILISANITLCHDFLLIILRYGSDCFV
jgi:hypothetical protein